MFKFFFLIRFYIISKNIFQFLKLKVDRIYVNNNLTYPGNKLSLLVYGGSCSQGSNQLTEKSQSFTATSNGHLCLFYPATKDSKNISIFITINTGKELARSVPIQNFLWLYKRKNVWELISFPNFVKLQKRKAQGLEVLGGGKGEILHCLYILREPS